MTSANFLLKNFIFEPQNIQQLGALRPNFERQPQPIQ